MNKSNHQLEVESFMLRARQDVPVVPAVPDEEIRRLRAKLILEEALETIAALGFQLNHDGLLEQTTNAAIDILEVIDGCCDIAVVTTGTLSAFGVPDLPFQREVNRNNLAKFKPGHSWREDGKLIKPPGHKPPNLAAILTGVMMQGQ